MQLRTSAWFQTYQRELKALVILLILFALFACTMYGHLTGQVASPAEAPPRVIHPG